MTRLVGVYEVIEVLRKTRADLFEDVKVGDILIFELTINRVSRTSGNLNATNILVKLSKDDEIVKTRTISINQLVNVLNSFVLAELLL